MTIHYVISVDDERRDRRWLSSRAAEVDSSVGTAPPTGPNPPSRLWQRRRRLSSDRTSKGARGSFLKRRPDRRMNRSEREEPGTITYPKTGCRYSLSFDRSFAIISLENLPDSSIRTTRVRSSGRGKWRGRSTSRSRSSFRRPFSFSERGRDAFLRSHRRGARSSKREGSSEEDVQSSRSRAVSLTRQSWSSDENGTPARRSPSRNQNR